MKLALDQEAHSGRPGSPYRLSPRELNKASPQPDPNAPNVSRYSVPPGKSTNLHLLLLSLFASLPFPSRCKLASWDSYWVFCAWQRRHFFGSVSSSLDWSAAYFWSECFSPIDSTAHVSMVTSILLHFLFKTYNFFFVQPYHPHTVYLLKKWNYLKSLWTPTLSFCSDSTSRLILLQHRQQITVIDELVILVIPY